jgi:hypothetical protein
MTFPDRRFRNTLHVTRTLHYFQALKSGSNRSPERSHHPWRCFGATLGSGTLEKAAGRIKTVPPTQNLSHNQQSFLTDGNRMNINHEHPDQRDEVFSTKGAAYLVTLVYQDIMTSGIQNGLTGIVVAVSAAWRGS